MEDGRWELRLGEGEEEEEERKSESPPRKQPTHATADRGFGRRK